MGREGVPARKAPELLLDEVFARIDIEATTDVLPHERFGPIQVCS
jgi:hypothetical protein